jgi:hypothetical protein
MKPRVTIIIGKDGNVISTDVEGAGTSCGEVTASVEKALGLVDESSRELTANYNKPIEGTLTLDSE